MWIYILGVLFVFLILYILAQSIRCYFEVNRSEERLITYNVKISTFDFGNITYIDEGKGEVILSVHGIFGGYDQAFETVKNFRTSYRVIAPSRFGYLGSDISGTGTPREQVTALVKLLDKLGIEKVYILGTSAGGTIAIRFALDYPERIKGLILYTDSIPILSSDPSPLEKPLPEKKGTDEKDAYKIYEEIIKDNIEYTRQMEGIREAKKKGVRFGRPETVIPEDFEKIAIEWQNGRISLRTGAKKLGVSHTTLAKWLHKARFK